MTSEERQQKRAAAELLKREKELKKLQKERERLAGMWQVFSIMLGWCGIEITQGKPFFTPK